MSLSIFASASHHDAPSSIWASPFRHLLAGCGSQVDEPEEASQKRRLSLQGLGAVERSLKPEMVAHVVDALFDKCAHAAPQCTVPFAFIGQAAQQSVPLGMIHLQGNLRERCAFMQWQYQLFVLSKA